MQGRTEVKFSISSTDNPISIKLPHDSNGNILGTRRKKVLEISDFYWSGTFPKVNNSIDDMQDVNNVPPNFFFFKADNSIVDGIYDENAVSSKVLDYAYPKYQLDSIPTFTPPINRDGGNTINDYGGISYDYTKLIYGFESNSEENVDIGGLIGSHIQLFIYSNLSYVDNDGNTKTKNELFKFANRNIQGLNLVSEPYILRAVIYDYD